MARRRKRPKPKPQPDPSPPLSPEPTPADAADAGAGAEDEPNEGIEGQGEEEGSTDGTTQEDAQTPEAPQDPGASEASPGEEGEGRSLEDEGADPGPSPRPEEIPGPKATEANDTSRNDEGEQSMDTSPAPASRPPAMLDSRRFPLHGTAAEEAPATAASAAHVEVTGTKRTLYTGNQLGPQDYVIRSIRNHDARDTTVNMDNGKAYLAEFRHEGGSPFPVARVPQEVHATMRSLFSGRNKYAFE